MSNRRAIATAALLMIALGLIVVLTLQSFAAREPARAGAGPTVAPLPAPAPAEPPPVAVRERASEPPPPWLRPAGHTAASGAPIDGSTDGSAGDGSTDDGLRARQMRQLHESMRGAMAAASQRSAEIVRHLNDALDTLEAMDDPELASQINLDAVRHNLQISMRMQTLAQRLQQVATEPPGPQRQQRVDATIAELRRLQGQLRHDVAGPGAVASAPGTAPGPGRGAGQ